MVVMVRACKRKEDDEEGEVLLMVDQRSFAAEREASRSEVLGELKARVNLHPG